MFLVDSDSTRVFGVFLSGRNVKKKSSGETYVLSLITVAIRVSMAGVGDKGRLLPGGTGFLAISGIKFLGLILF